MEYRRMGASGLPLSALALGTWTTLGARLGRGEARELVARAWDLGVHLFDTAESYACGEAEKVLGDVLADLRLPRDGFCVVSKAFHGSVPEPRPTQCGLSRKHLIDACHATLRRLRLDYLDLFLCHRHDPEVPLEEIVLAMDLLVRQGKVLYWGTSAWPAARVDEACRLARSRGLVGPSLVQERYSLLERRAVELEAMPLAAEHGIGLTTHSPLAGGLLSGRHLDGIPADSRLAHPDHARLAASLWGEQPERRREQVRAFVRCAAELGHSPVQLAIAWCLRQPRVCSVVVGAATPAQVEHAVGALALSRDLGEQAFERLQGCFAEAGACKQA